MSFSLGVFDGGQLAFTEFIGKQLIAQLEKAS